MLRQRDAWRIAALTGLGSVLVLIFFPPLQANDKKKEPTPALLKKADELKAGDAMDARLAQSPCKTYSIPLAEGKTYQIDLSSKFFDAFLRLEDAKGRQVAFNNDADASTFDSRIVFKAAQSGEYKIIAASADGKLGKFDLSVIEADKKAVLLTGSRFIAKPIDLTLKDGKVSQPGELDEKDRTALQRYYKVYAVSLEKDKTYRFGCTADNPKMLAVNLFLEDADGWLLDSSGFTKDGVTARIVHKAATAGTYRVILTTRPPQVVGRFRLDIVAE